MNEIVGMKHYLSCLRGAWPQLVTVVDIFPVRSDQISEAAHSSPLPQ